MSATPVECCTPCQTTPPVNIPGTPGAPGDKGDPGTNGQNSYTVTTANFNLPGAPLTNATMIVASSAWVAVNENIVASDGVHSGTFKVVSITPTTITGQWLNYPNDSAAGTPVNSGAIVGPAGYLPSTPITIAQGGTNATTKATAQASLGLGQNITEHNGTALAYDVTAPTPATITGMTVVAPATGLYLVVAWANVVFVGVTFAASRTITLKVRNTTAAADISTAAKATGAPTTLDYPAFDYHVPFKAVAITAGDSIALQIGMDVVESAGSTKVAEASIALIPLALS